MTRKENPGLLVDTLGLALRARGLTRPNPLVGAVLVTPSGKKFQGYHPYHGGLHAEAVVLHQAGNQARGGVLYCSLEPCCHNSKGKLQPPCAQAIIQAGVSKVVIGQLDPNPRVRGGGVALLHQAGIEVELSQSNRDFLRLNPQFNTLHLLDRPWIHLKVAITLDGKIAALDGRSKWITGPSLRQRVQDLRAGHDAVAVGIGTVLQDDPHLDLRQGVNQPMAVVFDRNLSIPFSSYLVTHRPQDLVIGCNPSALTSSQAQELKTRGVRFVVNGLKPDSVVGLETELEFGLKSQLRGLTSLGIQSMLVEGGARLLTSFLNQGLWDEITLHIAPSIMGRGISMVGDLMIKDSTVEKLTVEESLPSQQGLGLEPRESIAHDSSVPLESTDGPALGALELLNLEDPTWESLAGHGICHGFRPGWIEQLAGRLDHVHRTC